MEESTIRVIKRYSNRKMYDTQRSVYITLEEIAQLVQNGEQVKVVDNRNGNDLTSVTMAQIVFEEEKRHTGSMPMTRLRQLVVDHGQALTEFYHDRVEQVQARAEQARQRARELGRDLRSDWEAKLERFLSRADGAEAAGGQADAGGAATPAADDADAHGLGELAQATRRVWDDMHERVEATVADALRPLERFSHLGDEFGRLQQRLGELEGRIESLVASRGPTGTTASAGKRKQPSRSGAKKSARRTRAGR